MEYCLFFSHTVTQMINAFSYKMTIYQGYEIFKERIAITLEENYTGTGLLSPFFVIEERLLKKSSERNSLFNFFFFCKSSGKTKRKDIRTQGNC